MKRIGLLAIVLIGLSSCQGDDTKENNIADNKVSDNKSVASQYVIESNTMIFYDRSIADAIKARKFYKCIDVFTSNVTAKIIHSPADIKKFRVVSLIYDESQLLGIDLRASTSFSDIEFYLLGYIILDNGTGNSILEVIKPYSGQNIELSVKGIRTDLATLTNMTNDIQHVMNDQIVHKKDNAGTIPFRRINVFYSDVYVKNFQSNLLYKVMDIYRPAELSRSFTNPPAGSQASWFVTALPVNANKEISNGTLVYIKNPQIIQ
ncbi:MAG TPA: hypothetical protein VD996_00525 [Chitinophagaceae bacterium]|nr:hypothetical protein [Chitinophagaceae bacterium]